MPQNALNPICLPVSLFVCPSVQCLLLTREWKTKKVFNKKAVLSQGESRDAAANFDTCRILQRHHAVSVPQHGFLWYIGNRSNAEITHPTLIFMAVTQNHGDSRKPRHTTKTVTAQCYAERDWDCTSSVRLSLTVGCRCLKLFGREIIFEVFQHMWSWYLNVIDGQTDGQRDDIIVARPATALCIASRG